MLVCFGACLKDGKERRNGRLSTYSLMHSMWRGVACAQGIKIARGQSTGVGRSQHKNGIEWITCETTSHVEQKRTTMAFYQNTNRSLIRYQHSKAGHVTWVAKLLSDL